MIARRIRQLRKLSKVLVAGDYRAALWRGGVGASIEHEKLLKTFDFATVVDIGANRGQFALVSRHCFPGARIFSFEPLQAPADRFRRVLGHDPRITLHQVAIGPTASAATMHVSAADDSSSLLPITSRQCELFSGTAEVGTETIQMELLSACVDSEELMPPALLKIDVQGFELPVLQGCEPLLTLFSHVYVECSFMELYENQALADEVVAFLHQRRFGLHGVYNTHYDSRGQAIQSDLLFAAQTP